MEARTATLTSIAKGFSQQFDTIEMGICAKVYKPSFTPVSIKLNKESEFECIDEKGVIRVLDLKNGKILAEKLTEETFPLPERPAESFAVFLKHDIPQIEILDPNNNKTIVEYSGLDEKQFKVINQSSDAERRLLAFSIQGKDKFCSYVLNVPEKRIVSTFPDVKFILKLPKLPDAFLCISDSLKHHDAVKQPSIWDYNSNQIYAFNEPLDFSCAVTSLATGEIAYVTPDGTIGLIESAFSQPAKKLLPRINLPAEQTKFTLYGNSPRENNEDIEEVDEIFDALMRDNDLNKPLLS